MVRSRFSPLSATLAALALCALSSAQPPPPVVPKGVDLTKPLTLVDAVHVALANSTQIPIAANGVTKSNALATEARAAQLPNVTLSWSWDRSRNVFGSGNSNFLGSASAVSTSRTLQLLATQTFYQSGLADQVHAAFATADASRFSRDDTRRLLILTIANDYYTALATRALVDVAKRGVTASQQHLDASLARIAAGAAANSDRFPFDVELAQAQLLVVTNQTAADVALSNLKVAMGVRSDVTLQLADALARPDLPTNLSDLVRQAYLNRPDIQAQSALVNSARFLVAVAQATRGPVINANGSVGLGDFTGDTGTEWDLFLGATMPVFDAGLSKAKVTAANADLSTAQETLRQVKLNVGSEIERNYLTAAQSRAAIDTAETAVASARESRDAAAGKYAEGIGTVIDVTDAELKLIQAESDYVQALYNYNTSLASLKASLVLPPAPGL